MMRALETRVPPLAVLAVFAAAMEGIALVSPSWSWRFAGQGVVAVVVAVAGVVVIGLGAFGFRRHGTTLNPVAPETASTLVTSGIYGITRNPMYVGMALGLLGWAVWLGHPAAALLVPGFVAYLTRFQIMPEERAIGAKFGAAFDAYRARVRRWL
ncbi:isoprenylcysteine carboxylmethyltransferase family protein [Zavarzinia sp.]|uniref:methyltransferase family protein n=1 Tax=Zavarzinia sp. TaxID=2027920 RepID=UPI00356AE540